MRFILGSIVLAAGCLLVGCSGDNGSDSGAGAAGDAWPAVNRRAYTDSCVLNAEAAGAGADLAQDYCSCTLTEFERRYSFTEFAEAEQKMLRGEETGIDMQGVIDSCVSQVVGG